GIDPRAAALVGALLVFEGLRLTLGAKRRRVGAALPVTQPDVVPRPGRHELAIDSTRALGNALVDHESLPVRRAHAWTSGHAHTSACRSCATGSGKSAYRRRQSWTTCGRLTPMRSAISAAPTSWSTSTLRPTPARYERPAFCGRIVCVWPYANDIRRARSKQGLTPGGVMPPLSLTGHRTNNGSGLGPPWTDSLASGAVRGIVAAAHKTPNALSYVEQLLRLTNAAAEIDAVDERCRQVVYGRPHLRSSAIVDELGQRRWWLLRPLSNEPIDVVVARHRTTDTDVISTMSSS